jgi:hypothetical protein
MVGPGAPLQNILRALLKILQEPHYTDCTESPSIIYTKSCSYHLPVLAFTVADSIRTGPSRLDKEKYSQTIPLIRMSTELYSTVPPIKQNGKQTAAAVCKHDYLQLLSGSAAQAFASLILKQIVRSELRLVREPTLHVLYI